MLRLIWPLHKPIELNVMKPYVVIGVFLSLVLGQISRAQTQSAINGFDADGARHGLWKKYYPGTDQLRYEGRFQHGKEIGEFKYYCEKCGTQAAVIRNFDAEPGACLIAYYTPKGQLVAQGRLIDQMREGLWLTYHQGGDVVMMEEHYLADLLNGVKKTYYPNGQLAETCTYKMGELNGACSYFALGGELIKFLTYENDELHGRAEFYDLNGKLERSGSYFRGKKSGVWKTFASGVLIEEKDVDNEGN
jgi:antitoxin component YwqK of YwqJK toxin-antitoxin module